ncbi:MAG: hypothetical protein IIW56_05400 [Oscillospiraceae bacterium]|nr:hypothetical protein [Oscillospiraceae bacterium]
MKRRFCILILVSLLLCGCSKQQYHVGIFSYTKHCAEYGSAEFGVSIPDPGSQEKTPVRNAAGAVEVAKKYCIIKSPEISVDYDIFTGVYCVGFIQAVEVDGVTVYATGGQTVYVNKDGIVLLNILGE